MKIYDKKQIGITFDPGVKGYQMKLDYVRNLVENVDAWITSYNSGGAFIEASTEDVGKSLMETILDGMGQENSVVSMVSFQVSHVAVTKKLD